MNSPEGTYSYLLGIDIFLDYRLNIISLEEPNSLQSRLLKGANKWIEEGLEKMKIYK